MNLDIVLVLFQFVVLIFAFSVHECAHAYAAYRLGDATAFMLGRVTLNPVKHIDPFGSILMPLLSLFSGFPLLGWAKPCPVQPRNFRNYKRGDILTTLAGPASNLAMALLALIGLIILRHSPGAGVNALYLARAMTIPGQHPPLDPAHLPALFPLALLLYYGILTNVLLFLFNLIPVPPLDGSRIFRYALSYKAEQIYDRIGGFGIILIYFISRPILGIFYGPLVSLFDRVIQAL